METRENIEMLKEIAKEEFEVKNIASYDLHMMEELAIYTGAMIQACYFLADEMTDVFYAPSTPEERRVWATFQTIATNLESVMERNGIICDLLGRMKGDKEIKSRFTEN